MYPGIIQQENLANTEEQLRRLLFGKGQEGEYFDFNDLTTLYQDYELTTPVTTVGDTIRVAINKQTGDTSFTQMNSDPEFTTGATAWTAAFGDMGNWVFDTQAGTAEYDGTTHGACEIYSTGFTATPGKYYYFVVRVENEITPGTLYFIDNSSRVLLAHSPNYYVACAYEPTSTVRLRIGGNAHVVLSGFYIYEMDAPPVWQIGAGFDDQITLQQDGGDFYAYFNGGANSCLNTIGIRDNRFEAFSFTGSLNKNFAAFRSLPPGTSNGYSVGLADNGSNGSAWLKVAHDNAYFRNNGVDIPYDQSTYWSRGLVYNEIYDADLANIKVISAGGYSYATVWTNFNYRTIYGYSANSWLWRGRLYKWISVIDADTNKLPTQSILEKVEQYLADKAGITLP